MSAALDLGILTPVLQRRPGVHAGWERDAGIDEVRRIAETAERLGYDYLTCCEHVAVPCDLAETGGGTYWDALPTFGYLAAHTTRIKLATMVLVLPYHHPLAIAKRYGTLDRICGGRLVLGLGVGYSEREFELLGASFHDRGERSDDAIRALHASFGRTEPTYEGPYYRFDDLVVDPCSLQGDVPIWIGGMSRRSLRRAVELGDGWAPFPLPPEQIHDWLRAARETEAWAQRERPFTVVLTTADTLDPLGAPAETAATARALRDAGATKLSLRFVHDSIDQYLEQLEAMVRLIADL